MTQLSDQELTRYSRHLLLPELGFEGQEKIHNGSALVIGMGGLGCPAATYLATSGIGKLLVMDHDNIELTNLQRQTLYADTDIGSAKVEAAQRKLQSLNPEIEIISIKEKATADNLPALLSQVSIVLDCTDRFATRHLINQQCLSAKKILVMASALQWEGQLMVINPQNPDIACYECIFPEKDGASETSCALMGVFAPLTGMMGSLQALNALKMLAGLPVTENRLLMVSMLSGDFHHINLTQSEHCPYHR